MIVEISTETLQEFGISANDYLYLQLLCNKSYDILVSLDLDVNLEDLQTKGFLKMGENVEDHIVREKFLSTHFTPFDQLWSELLSHFPIKVQSNKGEVRVLRSIDPSAETNKKAKDKYEKYLRLNPNKHSEVIKALKTELDIKRGSDQMFFMQLLTTWVNQRTWEKYIGIDAEKQKDSRRITRQL